MRVAVLAVAMMAGAAVAAPVDLRKLPELGTATRPPPAGADATAIASAGADADIVLFALCPGDFVAIAGAHSLEARVDASLAAAFDAIVPIAGAVRLARAAKGEVE